MYFNPITPNSNQNYIPKFKDAGGYPKHQVFFGMSPIYGVGNTMAMSSSPYALSSSGSTVLSSSSQPWWRPAINSLQRFFGEQGPFGSGPKTSYNRFPRYGPSSFGNPSAFGKVNYEVGLDPFMRDPNYNPAQYLNDAQKSRYYQVMYGEGDPYSGVPFDQIPEEARFPSEYTSGAGWIDLIRGNEFFSSLPEIPIISDSRFLEWINENTKGPGGILRFNINPETGKFGHYYDQSITGPEYMAIEPLDKFIKYMIADNQQFLIDAYGTIDTREYMGVFDDQGDLYQVPYNDAYLNDKSLTKQEKADMKKELIKSGTFIDIETTPANELPKLFYFEEDAAESLPDNLRNYVYNSKNNNWTIENAITKIPVSTISNKELNEMFPSVDTTMAIEYAPTLEQRGGTFSYSHELLEELNNRAKPGEKMTVDKLIKESKTDKEFK